MAKPVTQRIKLYINGKEIDNTLTSIRKNLIKYRSAANKATEGTEDWKKYNKEVAHLEGKLNDARVAQKQFRQATGLTTAGLHKGATAVKKYDFSILGLVSSSILFADAIQEGISFVKEFISNSIELAEEAKGIDYAFNQIKDSARILEEARAASKGLISDLDIKAAANQFTNFNLDLDKLPSILEFVSVRAAQTGESFENLFSSAIEGLAKESKLRIDNLGISTKDLNAELEKTPNFLEAVANIAKREVTKAGSILSEAANSQQKWNVSLENTQLRVGRLINKSGVVPFFQKLGSAILNTIVPLESASKATEKERIQLLLLESKIKDVNTSTKDRVKLINQLKEKYPNLLANIDAEKSSNKELTAAIREVNNQLINKIILQDKDGEIASQNEKTAEKRILLFKQEADIRKRLVKIADDNNITLKANASLYEQSVDVIKKVGISGGVLIDPVAKLSHELNDLKIIQNQLNYEEKAGNKLLEEKNELFKKLNISSDVLGNKAKEKTETEKEEEKSTSTKSGKKGMNPKDQQIADSKKKLKEWLDQWEADQKIQEAIKDLEEDEASQLKEELELEAKYAKLEAEAFGEKELLKKLEESKKVELAAIEKKYADKKQKDKEEADKKYLEADKKTKEKLLKATESLEQAKTRALQFGVASLRNILGQKNGIYKAMFILEKALAIKDILINTKKANAQITSNLAIANMKALAASPLTGGFPMVGVNTAIASKETLANNINAGVQVASIAGTAVSSLDKGGYTFKGNYSGGMDGIGGQLAMIHPDEYMIPKPVMQMPEVPLIVEYLEAKRTGKPITSLADGGFTNTTENSEIIDEVTSTDTNSRLYSLLERLTILLNGGLKINFTLNDEVERQKLEDELNRTLKNAKS